MSNGILDFFPTPGPGPDFPGGELPNPRDIPEIIIKDQAAQQLGNIFDNAGITMINPSMVVDLADAVIDDELTLGQAFDIGLDSTIAGGVNTAAYGIPGFGQAKAGFDLIQRIEAQLGRALLPNEIRKLATGVFGLPNVITNRILNFRRSLTDDDTGGGTTGGGTVTIGGEPVTTGVSGPAGMGFIPPSPKKDRPPMGKAEGGLVSLAGYLKGR